MSAALDESAPPNPLAASFADLGVGAPLLEGLAALGFEEPTPIQRDAIPPLLAGRDLLGQAQTGTGKTAAFGLPLLQHLDLDARVVQGLVLTPTRELALQVTDALRDYAQRLGPVRVLTVYGGASIHPQLQALARGVHVVVGTPGRVIDCLERGALSLDHVRVAVLDEADEMLRMGFIEDVETILAQTPPRRQLALLSATMPPAIRRVADQSLSDPVTITVERDARSVETIEQRVVVTHERDKLEALVRILEVERSEAVLVFARTQVGCQELAEALGARGLAAAPLHGGMSQAQREDVVRLLREGRIQLVVATDVAARGLDVDGISHVVNFEVPEGPETYLHRIGRTGRAGREGVSILMLTPRERRIWPKVERYTRQRLVPMEIPTNAELAEGRAARFEAAVRETLAEADLDAYQAVVERLCADEDGLDATRVAAAIAHLASPHRPLEVTGFEPRALNQSQPPRPERPEPRPHPEPQDRPARPARGPREPRAERAPASGDWVSLYVSAGFRAGLRPGDLVGAVANECGLQGRDVGAIDIGDRYSFVQVAAEHADRVLELMGESVIRGRRVSVRPARPQGGRPASERPKRRQSGYERPKRK